MNTLISKARNRIVNLIIITLTLFLATTLAKQYFYDRVPEKRSSVGSSLQIQGVTWESAEQTLLLVLDANCPYSEQSIPFYRQLAEHAARQNDVRLIGVVNTSAEEGRQYTEAHDLRIDVIKWYFRKLKISQTPTLLLVNRAGEVTQQWEGVLSPASESDVITRFFGKSETAGVKTAQADSAAPPPSSPKAGPQGVSLPELLQLMKEQRVTLLDLDERESYAAEHIAQAKNIPKDELYIRALNELDKDAHIVLYTRNYNRLFLGNVQVLKNQGFDNVRILKGGLDGWKSAGLPVAKGQSPQ